MKWLFSIPLKTVNNAKTQENVSLCTGPKGCLYQSAYSRAKRTELFHKNLSSTQKDNLN